MLTDAYAKSILNCIGGSRTYSTTFHSGAIYIGLSSTEPTYAGGDFTEPSASEYARVLINAGTASSGAVTKTIGYLSSAAYHDGSTDENDSENYWYITNSTEIKFPEAVTDWGDKLTHFGLFQSSSTSTAPFFVGALTSPITVSATTDDGKVPIIRAGELIIKINTD